MATERTWHMAPEDDPAWYPARRGPAPGVAGLRRSRRLAWLVAGGSLGVSALLGLAVAHDIPASTSTIVRSPTATPVSGATSGDDGSETSGSAATTPGTSGGSTTSSPGATPGSSSTSPTIVSGGSATVVP